MGEPEDRRPATASEAANRAARMAAEAAQLAAHEESAARFAESITNVGAAVARELALPAILGVVLDQTVRTLGARFAYVLLADEEQRTLKLMGHRNLPDDVVDKHAEIPFDAPVLSARVAATRTAKVFSSLDQLDGELLLTRELLARTGCGSIVSLPLVARNRLVGVLTFALPEAHQFSVEERAALDNCAEIFSFGIANALSYEEERRLHALFEAVGRATVAITGELEPEPILQNIVDEARRVVDAEYAALGIVVSPDEPFEPWVFSGMTKEVSERIGRPPRPVGLLGIPALEGRSVRVADVQRHTGFRGLPEHHPRISSFLGVPVYDEERHVGTLYLANKRGATEFTHQDEQAIALLSGHAGAALRHTSLRQELNGQRSRLEAILQNAPYGVHFVEATTEKIIMNRRAVQIVGQEDIPTLSDYKGQLWTPEGTLLSMDEWPARRVLRGEPFETQEILLKTPDGRQVPILINAARIARRGIVEGAVVIYEDISILKELQRLREEWTSIVTHDLRQPLNLLMLQVGLLQRLAACPDPQRLYKAAERMQKATSTLNRMVTDLADASRIETKRMTLERRFVNLELLLHEVVERQQALTTGRTITLNVNGPLPNVEVDSLRIEQVLCNLLVNALKYSAPDTAVDVQAHVAADAVHVAVANLGAGISAEELPKIFDRYYRTVRARTGREGGLGIGLYIARGLIEAHGGRIWAESSPGGVTKLEFTLPLARAEIFASIPG